MKISYNWLKEYIDLDKSADEVANILTNIGLEVEDVAEYKGPGGGLNGLVVGQVKKVVKHPDADKLKVATVDTGNGSELQIVCGAPNVAEGQKVVVAKVGATLFPEGSEPFTIKKAKIRGVESSGMICAEDEIGMGTDHSGIIVLPENTPVGMKVKDFYGVKEDVVFEIGLTPNRADASGHLGVARDLLAALSIKDQKEYSIKYPQPDDSLFQKNQERPVEVVVENTEACPRYSGILLKNVQVRESPKWLQEKLQAVGVRPISNIVDVTNFILHEYGQPLHAFDADEITGNKVVVKMVADKTKFVTLDEVERSLDKEDLMICNAENGMCIAGVFGGLGSGVKDSTRNIFLESACFNPVYIRKTSARHNLKTDAAARFEKGTDPNITVVALKRAVSLMLELAGGEIASEIIDVYPQPVADFKVNVAYSNVERLIGHKIAKEDIKRILTSLGIRILEENNDGLSLSVPPFKVDVHREVDVIEEILRIYGFNNIPMPEQLRASLSFSSGPDHQEILNNKISVYLASCGFNEILNNSLSQSAYYAKTNIASDEILVSLLKSANAELNVLRNNMLFSALESLAYNLNRRNNDLKFFELGKTYARQTGGGYSEQLHLSLTLTGNKAEDSWVAKSGKADFYYLKSFVDNILKKAGITKWEEKEAETNRLKFGLQYSIENSMIAEFGRVNEVFQREFDIKPEVYFADFNWNQVIELSAKTTVTFNEIPKYPGIRRDLAILLPKNITYREVEKIAGEEVKRILKSVNLFDIYEDEKLGEDVKSYAVSYFFEDERKTLTDKDVDRIMEKLIARYKKELNADIR